jgi:hypothetical protein
MKFPWTKEPEVVLVPVRDERLDDPEWVPLILRRPNRPELPIMLMREFENPFIKCMQDIHPMANIAGLYWKPTAIYREVSDESE